MYGIWHGRQKRFVFGVRAETKKEAEQQFRKICKKIHYYTFNCSVKWIPPNYKNPPNPNYNRGKANIAKG